MSGPVDVLAPGTALRMRPADQLPANVERSWRPILGDAIWYLAGSEDRFCAVARTFGGYSFEFINSGVRDLFDVVDETPARIGGAK